MKIYKFGWFISSGYAEVRMFIIAKSDKEAKALFKANYGGRGKSVFYEAPDKEGVTHDKHGHLRVGISSKALLSSPIFQLTLDHDSSPSPDAIKIFKKNLP